MKLNSALYKIVSAFAFLTFTQQLQAQNVVADTVITINADAGTEKYIGYGKQKERIITSAIATQKGSTLRKAYTNNLGNTFYGRFAGLTVSPGGNEPGANSPALYARGVNTFGINSSPLVVIDGFLADYSQLVPEEIEEISVLKDAAATAIYGMRGANGVLLVTTKKGKVQPLAVNFNAQYGIQQPTALPNFLNSFDYARLYNEALANDGKAPVYTQADLDAYQNGTDPVFHPNVNWYDQVLRKTAQLSNFNLNFTGGNGTVRYFVLLNALTTQGLYKKFGDDDDESSNPVYNRYNFRANVDVTLNKRLSAQLNIGGSVEDKKNPGDLTTNSNINLLDAVTPNAFPVYNPNGSFGGNSTYSGNPVANLTSTGFSTSNTTSLQSSLRMTQQLDFFTAGLSASVAISFNNYYVGSSNKRKSYQRFSVAKGTLNDTVYTAFGQKTSLSPEESVLSQYRNYAIQASLNYDKVFGNHSFNGLLLFNSDNSTVNRNYPNTDAANQSFPYKTNNFATRLTYVNNDRYIVEFSGSYMGAENFPEDDRYGFFPAGSIGWIASNENFLKQSKLIDFLKLRLSYGQVGNEYIGGQRFAFDQRYPFITSYYLGSGNATVSSLGEGRRANPDVTWEKENKANIGVDINFAKRFGIVADVFKNNRHDVLASSSGTLPVFLGFNGLPDVNIGEVENKGFEFTLKYNSREEKTWRFFAEAMASYATNKIIFNGEPLQPNTNLYRKGSAIDQPFGLQAIGLFQSDNEIAASPKPVGIVLKPGDIKYQDIGGPNGVPDGIIDGNDATAIGKTSIPEWTFGLHTGVNYKRFDLSLIFQGVSGVTQYLGGRRYHAFQNNGQINEMALNRWTIQSGSSATYPRLSADNNQNNYRFSSFWQQDGSFIKLRCAEFGYSFSERTLNKLKLWQARVFINGTNLFSIDKIKEGDPEALYGYPAVRTISFGIKFNLK